MTETLTQIAEMYKEVAPNVNITYNFDSSGKLLTQISEGADCDLFISAAPMPDERDGRQPHRRHGEESQRPLTSS